MRRSLSILSLCAARLLSGAFYPATASAARLDLKAEQALQRALEDEYHAEAFYDAVIEKFGSVRPFVNIIKAERTHAAALADRMRHYGIEVTANALLKAPAIKQAVPASVQEACRMGVAAEIANRDLYVKDLLPAVAAYPDIRLVFERLSAASQENHLPAFERCAQRR